MCGSAVLQAEVIAVRGVYLSWSAWQVVCVKDD